MAEATDDLAFKVKVIVEALDTDHDGTLSVAEARRLFAELLDLDREEIPEDNAELLSFVQGSTEERRAKIRTAMTPQEINAYYQQSQEDKRPPPSKKKVLAILEFLDVDGFTVDEAKELFGEILDIEVSLKHCPFRG